jgi:dTDP-glucose pyrophosphorylase
MILLTLAAGLGTRAQSGDYIPKALIQVKDKPLVYWSIDSVHPLRTSGLIPNQKIFVGVRKSDIETFEFESKVKSSIHNHIQIEQLTELTNGPAESAYLIIKSLIKSGKINPEESILINDCDHHYNGNKLLLAAKKLEESNQVSILLCTTAKNPMDLSWSFIREDFGVITGVVEKPTDHSDKHINFAEGLIGTYGFSKAADYIYLYEKAIITHGKSEIFISRVIDEGIVSGYVKHVDKIFIENFTSLGTVELINKAIEQNSLGGEFKEAGTLFLDLDGTIFKHDSGGGVGEFLYSKTPTLVSDGIPNWIQSVKAYGYSIVITSARHESSRPLVEDQLEAFHIPFDELLLGLSGGPRFIFNDVKSSLACFPTSYSFNYPRNEFPVFHFGSKLQEISELSIHNEFLGESGERTFLLRNQEGFLVRKQSQNNDNSRNIISYQHKWLQTVSEFLPESVPVLKSTNIFSNDQLKYFDTEYIPDLVPLGDHLNELAPIQRIEKLGELINLLNELYSKFYKPTTDNFTSFTHVMEQKSLTGVAKGFELLNISPHIPISAFVNGKPLGDAWKNISMVLNKDNKTVSELLRSERDIQTLIHGDPTLSNVTTNLAGNIYLLDPIGARVLPTYTSESRGLGKAHPIYDLARINLSVEHEYERWANDIVVSTDGDYVDYSLHDLSEQSLLRDALLRMWPNDFGPSNEALIDLVYISTLARIFPYKAKSKKKEAFYLLGLLNEKCKSFNELYI